MALAPATEAPLPAAWSALAEEPAAGRGVVAAPSRAGGRWLFAAGLGPADAAGGPAMLVLEVASPLPMDLALTRERLAFLGALAEAGAADAAAAAQAPQALAAATARALLEAPERARGLHLGRREPWAAGLPGVDRVALLLPPDAIALSDQREVVPRAELPRPAAGACGRSRRTGPRRGYGPEGVRPLRRSGRWRRNSVRVRSFRCRRRRAGR